MTALIIILIIVCSLWLLCTLNYIIFERSVIATIVELVLWISPFKRNYKKATSKNLKQQPAEGKVPKLNAKIDRIMFEDMPVYIITSKKNKNKSKDTSNEKCLKLDNNLSSNKNKIKTDKCDKNINKDSLNNKNQKNNKVILFLHGGAYIKPPKIFHWRYCVKLANKLNAKVIFPMYPLAPSHTWLETHTLITHLYIKLIKEYDDIILMGDSAGGGLSASLCMSFYKQGIKLPQKTILFSPWVDLTMTNPKILKFENKDPMLSYKGAAEIGKAWSKGLITSNYLVSPKYGDVSVLKNTYVFVGTREILFPDIIEFVNKANRKDIKIKIQSGMNHDYPLFPIPEAHKTFKIVSKIIED